MCAPSAPAPPDYAGAAQAQGAANKEAAIASSKLNNPTVVSPYGTQTWEDTFIADTGEAGRPTVTQTFSPEQQALYNKQVAMKGLLGDLGTQGATALTGIVGKPLNISGSLGVYGRGRQSVIDSMMSRFDTDQGRAIERKNADLVAAGIRRGSQAYETEMDRFNRARTDALQQAEIAADSKAMDERKQAIAELLANRQTPLNEVSALMSGSQVSNPFATVGVAQNAGIQAAPLYNAALQQGQYGTDVYNAQVGQQNAAMSGLFGLGSGWATGGFKLPW